MSTEPDFAVHYWTCTFDERRGVTRALDIWLDSVRAGAGLPPDLVLYVSKKGSVRLHRNKNGKAKKVSHT